jgi:prepilin-type N-terminal cleavage/methylation domain-containing protein
MKTKKAFTMLELMICVIISGIFVVLFFIQKGNVEAMDRDEKRKVAINAMYYALEEGYYVENEGYPENIENAETLRWIEPDLYTDPTGLALWQEDSNYTYESSDCENGKCKSYTLRAKMEKEADYIKTSRH